MRGEGASIPGPIASRLACPDCGRPLAVTDGGAAAECRNAHRWPFRDGYLDCSHAGAGCRGPVAGGSTARTFESFGYEWNRFDDVRAEDAEFARVYFRDLDLGWLAGKVVLDAGCGKGRYTRFLAPRAAAVAALDGSSAVEAAVRNLAGFDNVLVVRSDLRSAPLAPESVDLVTCLGVLHHLDDPREGFDRLLGHLAPGGRVLLYLYSRPERSGLRAWALALAAWLRRVTVRIPHRLLRPLTVPVAALLWAGLVVPGTIGERRGIDALRRLPMDAYRGKPFRSLSLDTFDRLSAPVEHRFVWREIEPWFTERNLRVEAARDETGWFVLARKPDGAATVD